MQQKYVLSGDPWGIGDDEVCKFDARTTEVTAMTMGFETLLHNDMDVTMNHLANVGQYFSIAVTRKK